MPIYEYRCLECGRISEIFLRSLNNQNVQCPACGSYKLDRLLSASYTVKTDASTLRQDLLWQDRALRDASLLLREYL